MSSVLNPVVDVVDRTVAEPIRRAVSGSVIRMVGSRQAAPDDDWLLRDRGDRGWFGPDSVAWRVHADLPAMLIGGISALLLQTLHPGAMAGVADHSRYKEDATARLHRIGTFIVNTTYGSSREAQAAVDAVQRIHDTVVGVRPDGIPYSANDPDLLTFVHVAEVGQFLRGYQRYGPWPLSADEVDRYYREVAVVARRLGAVDVPTSAQEVRDYYRRVRLELALGDQAREAVAFLIEPRARTAADRAVYRLIAQAAIAILPRWARPLLGLAQPRLVTEAVRVPTWTGGMVLRWALGETPVLDRARRRINATDG
jgi:uncharacterized protein (DUF2236 family)